MCHLIDFCSIRLVGKQDFRSNRESRSMRTDLFGNTFSRTPRPVTSLSVSKWLQTGREINVDQTSGVTTSASMGGGGAISGNFPFA